MKTFIALAACIAATFAYGQAKEDPHAGHAGHSPATEAPAPKSAPKSAPMPMEHEHHMEMQGAYGAYPMAREASGTAWQPDSSPHTGIMTMAGDWHAMIHGFVNAVYDHQGGPRGDTKSFSESMLMVMAQRPTAGGTLGLRTMVSLDPLMGKSGYPMLFQTGETANGSTPLIDRQHPHNLFMELAASYSHRMTAADSVFVYAGLPGELALGPPAFMHRFSGMDSPEAPLTHHWMDSTHITNGVVTIGYVRDRLKLEASAFHGREPDQFRYRIEPGRLDSGSVRISFNPTDDCSLQLSHGFIKSPETLEPGVDVRRTTASMIHNVRLEQGNWQTTLAWGRNANDPGKTLDGYLVESALALHDRHTFFGRVERVQKDELFEESAPQHGETFTVNKLSLGYIRDWKFGQHARLGIGGLASAYSIPASLEGTYGRRPTSYMLFARIRLD